MKLAVICLGLFFSSVVDAFVLQPARGPVGALFSEFLH